ncbi:carboxypeptidase regulatory-like domain-containing protein [Planotetraspora thailandica]|uniref:carboxypeptidase regulatory-like domain-containing protein n=1 Tax=Planotetraspora thailandica TaxID=487172 RepID=UPI00194DC7D5|nr:carboxypeptidase regulatory-like domain-containing protein [Planotetraspora thailandica]
MLTLGAAPSSAATSAATPPAAGQSASGSTSGSTAEQPQPLCDAPAEGRFSCFALRRPRPAGQSQKRVSAAVAPDGYGPADLIGAYRLPADGGAGQTVAIVDAFDAPTAEADLAVYRAQYGLPPCTTANGCFRKVDQRGGTDYPVPDGGWAGEIALDLDMVSAVAPRADILLVEADSNYPDDLGAAVDQAVAMGAKFVSNSYGTDREYPDDATLDVHYNHPGVAIVASSGDYGYGVSYPAASPYVTAVGGTSLVRDSSARGWSETVWNSSWLSSGEERWGAAGSGCSVYGAKPGFQSDPGCPGRTVADVSAVADPVTGVAVYNSYSDTGWSVYGGTSASSPIIAGVYAIAGTPVQGTDANSYVYANRGGLNDVVSGDNASCPAGLCGFGTTPSCDPSYLCVAGAGYDGPTGLGTPSGVASFRGGPHGTIAGTVTDATTKAPIPGALVSFGAYSATSGPDGGYRLSIPAGDYTGTVGAYGYKQASIEKATLGDGATLTRDVALEPLPSQTVSGTVTDGGGHGWPMYAKVGVAGVPGAPVWTDPVTGVYRVKLPQGVTYALTVTAAYPGYLPATASVTVGTKPVTANVAIPVDAQKASAPGYTLTYHGGGVQPFDDRSAPAGWTVKNNNDNGGWQFDDPLGRGNQTGGGGGFAIVDDFHLGWAQVDTELRSPSYDLSKEKDPVVEFETHFPPFQRLDTPKADVDVSTDGGSTWTTVWTAPDTVNGPAHESVSLKAYAGRSDVRLRFHYAGGLGNIWEVDKVAVGTRTFAPAPGGLVVGQVTDANTGAGVVGATVSGGSPGERAISVPTPDDLTLGDGLYWLFSPKGERKITAEKAAFHYPALTEHVKVSGGVTRADFALKAGRLAVAPAALDAPVTWGSSRTLTFTVRNTGAGPATFRLGERPGSAQPEAGASAPVNRVKVPKEQATADGGTGAPVPGARSTQPAGTAWRPVADLPVQGTGMVAGAYNGKLYAGLGNTGQGTTFSNSFSSYDPATDSWTTLTSPWYRRWAAAGAFVDGRFYVTSGRDSMGGTVAATEAYDPKADSWQTLAPNPEPYGSSGVATLDGKLYLVGGCRQGDFGSENCNNNTVMVYDPAADHWSKAAPYPAGAAYLSCGGIDGKVYCAGGIATTAGYAYDPAANSWSPIAGMPLDLMGSAYAVANGRLLVSTGYSYGLGADTNEGFAYDPAADAWSPLPNAGVTVSGAAGAPGFYLVGGTDPATGQPSTRVETLPGYDRPYADVPWLSARAGTTRLAPGKSTTVTVTLDADPRTTSMLTDYTAAVTVAGDTPYTSQAVPVTMRVRPPASWGRLSGTVRETGGRAVAGATVTLQTERGTHTVTHTVTTGADGGYEIWLAHAGDSVRVTVTAPGHRAATGLVRIKGGDTAVRDFTLQPAS